MLPELLPGLPDLPPGTHCLAVAYSGGRDSTALLHACLMAARADSRRLRVAALHVHHGLHPNADAWLAHGQAQCAAWAQAGLPVDFSFRRLALSIQPGDSVEAVARDARYAALADMARHVGAGVVMLAHHQHDQAETFVLQALRGAGPAGLSAMPARVERHGVVWLRPWLNLPRHDIEAYVAAHGLAYVDDDSNSDLRYARNRVRQAVWPALTEQFPQAGASLAHAARHCADTLWCAQQWLNAQLPMLHPRDEHTGQLQRDRIDVRLWGQQAEPARRELLRHWYGQLAGRALSRTWLERLCKEVLEVGRCTLASESGASDSVPAMQTAPVARTAHWPQVGLGLYRGQVRWLGGRQEAPAQIGLPVAALAVSRAASQVASPAVVAPGRVSMLHVAGPGVYPCAGWPGQLEVREAEGDEPRVPWPMLAQLSLRERGGGENFQLAKNRPARGLKKQFQALGVPPWMRDGPLFYAQDRLLFVPGLGLDARARGEASQSGAFLIWRALPSTARTG